MLQLIKVSPTSIIPKEAIVKPMENTNSLSPKKAKVTKTLGKNMFFIDRNNEVTFTHVVPRARQ